VMAPPIKHLGKRMGKLESSLSALREDIFPMHYSIKSPFAIASQPLCTTRASFAKDESAGLSSRQGSRSVIAHSSLFGTRSRPQDSPAHSRWRRSSLLMSPHVVSARSASKLSLDTAQQPSAGPSSPQGSRSVLAYSSSFGTRCRPQLSPVHSRWRHASLLMSPHVTVTARSASMLSPDTARPAACLTAATDVLLSSTRFES
jgi:hypothetical protein